MKNNFERLKCSPLFDGIAEVDFEKILSCLNAKEQKYKKDSVIFLSEEKVSFIGIVLFGTLQVVKSDVFGNQTILTELSAGELFGETFAFAEIEKLPVTVLAVTDCEILQIDPRKIANSCASACVFHTKLMENMLKLLALKNLTLNQKIEFLSKRSTREKLLSFFGAQLSSAEDSSFTICFSRQELADFLCVERSAMSRELGKMRDDGILSFKGNRFKML